MLFTVASALMYVERRSLVDVFPDDVKKVWNDWELRVLILLSLTCQIVLILLGNCRKYIPRTRIRVILWSAYLMADWVATVALGVISRIVQDDRNKNKHNHGADADADADAASIRLELVAFWAPFLLLHLGGPDTITAYALEDNELWLRHLVGLVIQTGVALYIFLMAWPGHSYLPILSILILIAGLIKYGERTWALRSGNSKHFRDSMLTPADPGPNYAKFMEEFTLKKAEGFHVKADEVIELPVPTDNAASRGDFICEAYDLFQTFKRLFVDLILSFQDRDSSKSYFQKLCPEQAFRVIEVELGFAFDVFYTKATVAYTRLGCIMRLVSFSCVFSVLVAFVLLFNYSEVLRSKKQKKIDLIITFLLLLMAVVLEIYAFIVMLYSDWAYQWLSKNKHNRTQDFPSVPCLQQSKKSRWSNSMAQYNVLSVSLRDKRAVCFEIQRLFQIDELREHHRYKTYSPVSKDLKALLFNQFNGFSKSNFNTKALCTHRGSFALKEIDLDSSLGWSTTEIEYDQSILIWHIATDLCYYMELGAEGNPDDLSSNCRESKHISDYMLYLLVMCPFMLPIGIGMIRFRDTCAEAMEFFQERGSIHSKVEACEKLLQVNTEVSPLIVKGDRSKSVLFDACRCANRLKSKKEDKWNIVSRVWVEILAYAATHCRGNHHAQQLRKGGELLTHVWLLMAHLGITEQFQITQGHARAKLIVK